MSRRASQRHGYGYGPSDCDHATITGFDSWTRAIEAAKRGAGVLFRRYPGRSFVSITVYNDGRRLGWLHSSRRVDDGSIRHSYERDNTRNAA